MDHLLVVANETVAGRTLIDAIERRAELKRGPAEDGGLVTVVCPISRPREGYVVYEDTERGAPANVLVIANETVLGRPLLDRVRERARRSPASFLIVCPQSDPGMSEHPQAERRLRRAVSELR